MQRLSAEIANFFRSQSFIIVCTINGNGSMHASCKGIVQIDQDSRIYLLDLYKQDTFKNLKTNPSISIIAIDEHKFKGYCLKGSAKIISITEMNPELIEAWHNKITTRITQRVIKNIVGEKSQVSYPEALLPKPQYLIAMEVDEIVDLTPRHIKEGAM